MKYRKQIRALYISTVEFLPGRYCTISSKIQKQRVFKMIRGLL